MDNITVADIANAGNPFDEMILMVKKSACAKDTGESNPDRIDEPDGVAATKPPEDNQIASPFADGEKGKTTPKKTTADASALGLSDDLISFQFILDEVTYTLPFPNAMWRKLKCIALMSMRA